MIYTSPWSQMNQKPTAYVLVGLPGSGKSTWAKNHPDHPLIASTDSFIEDFATKENLSYDEAFQKHYQSATRLLKEQIDGFIRTKESFIWDQVNLIAPEREAIYNILHASHQVVYVCFLTPLEICLERHDQRDREGGKAVDQDRIKKLAHVMRFPTAAEQHDKIISVTHPAWHQK